MAAAEQGDNLDRLSEVLRQGGRLTDAVGLAGTALVAPLVSVRRRQAALEAARTERRLGPDHPETRERQAQARIAEARGTEWQQDLARQSLQRPDLGENAGLYGRVTSDGKPVAGLIVSALNEGGDAVARSCTGRDGDYSLSFAGGMPVRIELRDEAGKPIFRDKTGFPYPPYRATHRDIELSRARPPCPEDKPGTVPGTKSEGGTTTTTLVTPPKGEPPKSEPAPQPAGLQMPNLVGMPVSRAMETIKALGLELGDRKTKRGKEPDVILAQDPGAGTPVERGAKVVLVISVAEAGPARDVGDLTGRTLHQAVTEIGKAGADIASVTVSTDGAKTPTVVAATPDAAGSGVHIEISTTGGNAKMMDIAATVIGQSPEGAAHGLEGKAAAAEWLAKHKLTSLADLAEVAAMEDVALRRRLRLGAQGDIVAARKLLQAVVAKIREA
ncbi:MAG: PASTA domain-containing protein [Allosphingosinicella sp.]